MHFRTANYAPIQFDAVVNHLIVCREFPPAPGGGIGTYTVQMARLLAAAGDTVHVLAQTWRGAERPVETTVRGHLIVHRVPFERPAVFRKRVLKRAKRHDKRTVALFSSAFFPEAFSWQIASLVEDLVLRAEIDVIEAPEYQAPLHHFLLGRASGRRTGPMPPCLVHLHSPTEDIVRHNGWDANSPFARTAKRLEDHSIRAADTLVAPSQYLARLVESRFDLSAGAINVIPYPLGDAPPIAREQSVWTTGSITYVGRLEGRKGAIQWIDAAVRAARQFPEVRFDFLGENLLDEGWLSGRQVVAQRIPSEMRRRFLFHGAVPRERLQSFLAQSRMVAVPSQWDNFPNACMEALASGAPVLATREGGMAEMIEHGRTGWLAARPDADALHQVLVEALQTPPAALVEMGRSASASIRRMCDNDEIVRRHRDLRRRMIEQGPTRSCVATPVLDGWGTPEDGGGASVARPQGAMSVSLLRHLVTRPAQTTEFLAHALVRRIRHRLRGR